MNYKLAKQLRDAGFPQTTRWEVENNYRRPSTVTGVESLPPLGALISETNTDDFILIRYGEKYIASNGLDNYFYVQDGKYPDTKQNIESGYAGKEYVRATLDGSLINPCLAATPEEAVANLYLALYTKDNETKTNKNNKSDLSDDTLVPEEI